MAQIASWMQLLSEVRMLDILVSLLVITVAKKAGAHTKRLMISGIAISLSSIYHLCPITPIDAAC